MLELQKYMCSFFHIIDQTLKVTIIIVLPRVFLALQGELLNISLNIPFFSSLLNVVHILLSGKDTTALYSWNSERNQFSVMLEAPYADHIISATARSLNSSKSLIALSIESNSQIYELTTISNQSDFIPRLVFLFHTTFSQLLHFFSVILFLLQGRALCTSVCGVLVNTKENFSQVGLKQPEVKQPHNWL